VAFAAAQRRREIAIRLLLGATRRDVVQLVLRDARGLVVAGSALGLGAAWLSGMLVRSIVFGTGTVDAAALAIGAAGLAVLALAVCMMPAIRSSTTAPLEVLRST
jgi:ABC-type antimicrobial peptide transport system permease subunit